MTRIEWEDGLTVDDETGEVFGLVGTDKELLHYLARLHREAGDREKGWTERKQALARAIVQQFEGQPGTENFEDVTVKAQRNPSSLDRDEWRDFVMDTELTHADLTEVAYAATSFDMSIVTTEGLQDAIGSFMKSKGVHARTTWALKEVPKRVEP
jgi:hypothetical protein